jgi:hypothetical protein
MSLPSDPKHPYAGLPPHPTIGEIIAKISQAAAENLAKVDPPQSRPTPDSSE